MGMKAAFVVMSALFMAGCDAYPQDTEMLATAAEKDWAQRAFTKCLVDNVHQIDDRISGADVVAAGLLSSCAKPQDRMIAVFTQGKALDYKARFRRLALAGDLSLATELVLRVRSRPASAPGTPPAADTGWYDSAPNAAPPSAR